MSWIYWQCGNCQKEYKVSKETDEQFLKHGILYPICNRCKKNTGNLRNILISDMSVKRVEAEGGD